jgi:hypothetical protein
VELRKADEAVRSSSQLYRDERASMKSLQRITRDVEFYQK